MNPRTLRMLSVLTVFALAFALTLPALAKEKMFSKSEDAGEEGEPQTFLPDYDKLVQGKNADWVYFTVGDMKSYGSVIVKDFGSTGTGVNKTDSKHAAEYGREYMEKWLGEQGFKIVESGGVLTIEGNVFNAWEPSTAARVWGGWMANPGCGLEIIARDSSGKILAEIRHKSRGSTVHDAVENGLEEIVESLATGK